MRTGISGLTLRVFVSAGHVPGACFAHSLQLLRPLSAFAHFESPRSLDGVEHCPDGCDSPPTFSSQLCASAHGLTVYPVSKEAVESFAVSPLAPLTPSIP